MFLFVDYLFAGYEAIVASKEACTVYGVIQNNSCLCVLVFDSLASNLVRSRRGEAGPSKILISGEVTRLAFFLLFFFAAFFFFFLCKVMVYLHL